MIALKARTPGWHRAVADDNTGNTVSVDELGLPKVEAAILAALETNRAAGWVWSPDDIAIGLRQTHAALVAFLEPDELVDLITSLTRRAWGVIP